MKKHKSKTFTAKYERHCEIAEMKKNSAFSETRV
jgi:hypothetical protein